MENGKWKMENVKCKEKKLNSIEYCALTVFIMCGSDW